MRRLHLVIGTHNHLPLGEAEETAEASYQQGLRPFLSTLYAFPEVPAVVHASGILLEWLEERHPEYLMLLAEMVDRRQVEILGGGYYDPILPMIPANDRLGQLEKMTTHLRGRFGTRPRGCWLAEGVWEPSLASLLRTAGMDYTFLDDTQLRLAGCTGPELFDAYVAEDQGKGLGVIPVATRLVDAAATGTPDDLLAELSSLAEGDAATVALVGHGGSFGPPFAANGWLERFLALLRQNAGWLEPVTPGILLRDRPPWRRLYLPCSASERMAEWALAPDRRRAYREARSRAAADPALASVLTGGTFRQFLARYPEAGMLYAKMLHVHVLVHQLRGDRYRKRAAQHELWKGQCHYAYWFGGSRGLYANRQRKATYRSLIEAEKIIRATEIFAPSVVGVDFDLDNNLEYLYQGSELNAYLHARGGALFELDFLPAAWNYLDTLARRDEGRGGGDLRPRRAFLDHFFSPECTMESFAAGGCPGVAGFADALYETIELNRTLPEVLLRATGPVLGSIGEASVRIEKRFVFRPRSIDVYYRVSCEAGAELAARLGVEINVSLADRSRECARLFLVGEEPAVEIGPEPRSIATATGLLVRDVRNEVSITLSSAAPFGCWSLPVETRLPAGEGEIAGFQSQCLVALWELRLAPGSTWENHLSIGFEKAPERTARDA